MTGLRGDCQRAARIDDRIAASLEIGDGELEFLESHIAACDKCRVEARAFRSLRRDDGEGVAERLDDLSRRRLIDQVIAGARQPERDRAIRGVRTGAASRKWLTAGFAVGAAAAAAVYLLVSSSATAPGGRAAKKTEERVAAAPAADGLVTLLSGEVLSGPRSAAVGERLSGGQTIETREGVAAVELGDGVAVLVGGNSLVAIGANPNALEVELKSGSLLASVTPGRGRSRFAVTTAAGKVMVKGTVFKVSVDDNRSEVKVLRGEVELVSRGGSRPLAHGNAATFGSDTVSRLADDEEAELTDAMRLLELLEPELNTVIDISSQPEGADVFIDGVGFCRTPCSALVRSGDREVELSLAGESKVHELVDMAAGARVSRVFKLENDEGASRRGRSEPTRRELSAKEMLSGAQAARAKRDFQEAANLYGKLIDTYPGSNEATISLVSLGEIRLEKLGDPHAALMLFSRYLKDGKQGALTPEALFGKARAERALGRTAEEKETLRTILKRFPKAVQSAEAHKRLSELGS